MLGEARNFPRLGLRPGGALAKFLAVSYISLSLCPRWVKTRRGAVLCSRLKVLPITISPRDLP